MYCIICDSEMIYYFSKKFNCYGLNSVDYCICKNCGFVASKTHYEMSGKKWEELNIKFHRDNNIRKDNPHNRNQRYFNQSLMLFLMKKYNFFSNEPFLDWGSGIGSVSKISDELFNVDIRNYDRYIKPHLKTINENELIKRKYNLVINNAVFEHVTKRKTLDEIESYVTHNGCFAIHTLVPETIPKDPDFMYFLPVHCSFHTNRSMEILINQWGYSCSVYNEHSKMWILFKTNIKEIAEKVEILNKSIGWNYLKFKPGFMDYWK